MNLRTLAIIGFIFGAYSRFRIDLGPVFIPYFISFFSAILLLILAKGKIHKNTLYFIIGFTGVSFLTLVFTFLLVDVRIVSIVESFVFLIYSVSLGAVFLDSLCKFDDQKLANIFFKITIGVLFLCLLDIFTPFHQVNLLILDLMGGHNQGEFASDREANYFFGIRRPFPFTQEPSHVSKLLMITMPGWFILSKQKKLFTYFGLCVSAFLIIRSPVIIGAIILGVLFLITREGARSNMKVFASSVILIFILMIVGGLFSYIMLESRINSIVSGGDPSTSIRLIRPFLIVKESLIFSPFVGVGVGNTEKLAELYLQNYTILINDALGKGYTISALLAPIAYWGLIGSFFHYSVIVQYIRKRGVIKNWWTLFVFFLLISLAMGAFNTIAYWGYIFLIVRIFYNINHETSYSLKPNSAASQ